LVERFEVSTEEGTNESTSEGLIHKRKGQEQK